MHKIHSLPAIAALLAFLVFGQAFAQVSSQSVTDHGLTVYFGVVPAEIARGIAKTHGESDLHPDTPKRPAAYHLIVAIFNAVTGERITDATITASMAQFGKPAPTETLEPMKIADTVSYGNFFDLPTHGVYRIHLNVLRSDRTRSIEIDLHYERP